MFLCPARARITLYEHLNFVGESRTFTGSNPNVGSVFNDKTTSARVTPGEVWVLYEDSSFRGRQFVVSSDVANVGSDFNDKTTSLRRIK